MSFFMYQITLNGDGPLSKLVEETLFRVLELKLAIIAYDVFLAPVIAFQNNICYQNLTN